ncbi:MAG: 4Fe-4S dicluster domain-containing protein [Candidatus Heimdallarchaeota archaeon]|nr:4Fe-4S dicluster domain-containing protein [Candidatus Heimdallarchaeota archaeon]
MSDSEIDKSEVEITSEDTTSENKGISRRTFLKLAVTSAVVGGVGYQMNKMGWLPTAESDIPPFQSPIPDNPDRHWGFMIDLNKCDGCENLSVPEDDPTGEKPRCSYACRVSHQFMGAEPPQYWIRVYKLEETPGLESFNFPKPCQNCQDAPCVRVCPTGASFSRPGDGTVLINHNICVGCRFCMAACPYETRFFWYNNPPEVNEEELHMEYSPEYALPHQVGTVAKCDYCLHNVYFGKLPHCVPACPNGALYFGDLNEDVVTNGKETIQLKETLNARSAYRYKEDEGTNPSVYYLPAFKEDA